VGNALTSCHAFARSVVIIAISDDRAIENHRDFGRIDVARPAMGRPKANWLRAHESNVAGSAYETELASPPASHRVKAPRATVHEAR
jgi:hypothetical protein